MEYGVLGSSSLQVSAVGFGCWQAGGYYWGHVDERDWIAAVHRALDLGVTFFDTADFYGFGRSEELLAKALDSRRREVVIATKVGLISRGGRRDFGATDLPELERYIEKDLSRKHILEAAEASLRRLRTDAIDLYLLHWPDPATPVEETATAMQELLDAGKVRAVGCCNFPVELMQAASARLPLDAHQLPYSTLHRDAEEAIIPACQAAGIGVIAYWALCKGLLSGKYEETAVFGPDDWRYYDPLFQGAAFRRNLQTVSRLQQIAATEGITVGQLAISWVISRPGIASAIVGAKSAGQAAENAAAGDVSLSSEAMASIAAAIAEKDGQA